MYRLVKILKNKVFVRLFLMFLAIMLVTYSFGMTGLLMLGDRARIEKIDTIQSKLINTLDDLESEMISVMGLISDHIVYEEVMNLAVNYKRLSPYQRSVHIQSIQRIFSFIKNRSSYIKDIKSNLYTADRSIGQIGQIDSINPTEITMMQEAHFRTGNILLKINGNLHIFIQYPAASRRSSNVLFSVDTLLDTGSIKKEIMSFVGAGGQYVLDFSGLGVDYSLSSGTILPSVSNKHTVQLVKQDDNEFYWMSVTSGNSMLNLSVMIPAERFSYGFEVTPYLIGLITFVFLSLALLYSIWLQRYINHPIKQLICRFGELEEGRFGVKLSGTPSDEFKEIFTCFNHVSDKLGELFEKNIEQAILTKNAQLQQLEAQVNPHFLYNSFNLLNSILYQGDVEAACEYSHLLSRYYYYVTRNDGSDIPLKSEIEHARTYAEIQARRFDGRITVIFPPLPEKYSNLMVPRIIIQPLIENAFEHGLQKITTGGIVRLDFHLSNDQLCISVNDNGSGLSQEQIEYFTKTVFEPNKHATGIINIARRLVIKYGEGNALRFSKSDLGGLSVTMSIPIHISNTSNLLLNENCGWEGEMLYVPGDDH